MQNKKPFAAWAMTLLTTAAALACAGAQAQSASDPVVLSFATVGDSRQDNVAPDTSQLPLSGQDVMWMQNTKAFGRILREIAAKKANLLFFNGDMVLGYGNASPSTAVTDVNSVVNSDLVRFYTQYAYWRGMAATLMEAGTYVVPVPGNHETQCRTATAAPSINATTGAYVPQTICGTALAGGGDSLGSVNGGKNAIPQNEDAFRANMGDLILDQARLAAMLPNGQALSHVDLADHAAMDYPFVAGNAKVLAAAPQNQLSYSFDVGSSHFVVINNDVSGGNDNTAPVNWLNQDLQAAKLRGARGFFVFGHKPAYTYNYAGNGGKLAGLDANAYTTANRDAFWNVIQTYGATYFSGHQHTFSMGQPKAAPSGSLLPPSWQVIVGAGGSPFDPKASASGLAPTDRDYVYAVVNILQSGNVVLNVYGFTSAYGPTKLIGQATIAPVQ
ncbi:metallophosphoesterase [Pelomonas sp. KK5]|uniref:metallophosphoesterase family protein n=1 Tax=Pelomonas sp. KK5 TaxID=1855730 RepID=UPI00097C4D48|nr:metallophosphoesterase [Pelomonas sp. KK5]